MRETRVIWCAIHMAHRSVRTRVVGVEMRGLFEAHGGYENACGSGQFCQASTTGVRTREEMYYLGRGSPVYRLLFVRDDQPVS